MKKLISILTLFCAYFAGMFSLTAADVYSDSIMLEARSRISDQYQKQLESRLYNSKLLDAFIASSVQLDPKVANVDGQTAKILYLKDKVMTVATSRTCSPSGEQSGSGIDTLSFVERAVTFKVSKSQALKNDYGYAGIFANELWNAEKSLFLTGTNGIDSYLATQLASYVSSVNAGDTNDGTLNGTIMEIAKANVNRFYDIARGHAELNNFGMHPFMDIHNTFWQSTHKESNYGVQTNLIDSAAAQGFTPYASNRIDKGAYGSRHYLIPMGGIGIVFLPDELFRAAEDRGTYKRFVMQSMIYPGIELSVKHIKDCADTTSDGGRTDDDVDTWVLSVKFATFDTPLSSGTTVFDYATMNS